MSACDFLLFLPVNSLFKMLHDETPILWPPDAKSGLIWKDPDAGKDWGQEEKGTTEDEMVGWHHQLYGHGSGWTEGVGDGQGGLACCSSCGRKESDATERLNWTEKTIKNICNPDHVKGGKIKYLELRLVKNWDKEERNVICNSGQQILGS